MNDTAWIIAHENEECPCYGGLPPGTEVPPEAPSGGTETSSGQATSQFEDTARGYLARGWKLFAVRADKVPIANCDNCRMDHGSPADYEACQCLTCHGFYAATDNLDRLMRQVDKVGTEVRLAVRTGAASGIVVLDLDPEPGVPGRDLAQLRQLATDLGAGIDWDVRTPGGGLHFFFAYPGDRRVPTTHSKLAPGIDVQSDLGYVLLPAPGSGYTAGVLTDGKTGEDRKWWATGADPVPMPEALLVAIDGLGAARQARAGHGSQYGDDWVWYGPDDLRHLLAAAERLEKGSIQTGLYQIGCWGGRGVAAGALDESVVHQELAAIGERLLFEAGMAPAKARTEAWRQVGNGLGDGQRDADPDVGVFEINIVPDDEKSYTAEEAGSTVSVNEPGTPGTQPAVAVAPKPPAGADIPPECEAMWELHPILGEIRDLDQARRVNRWALLAVGVARVLSAVPYSVTLPPIVGESASLNFYVALTGPSGAKKGTAIRCSYNRVVVENEGSRENLGTGEGLIQAYLMPVGKGDQRRQIRNPDVPSLVMIVDEITGLGDLAARDGSTIGSDLRSAWSGEQLGRTNATPGLSRKLEADTYRLCLIAGVQPERSDVLFSDTGAGLPQRFAWAPVGDPNRAPLDLDGDWETDNAPMIAAPELARHRGDIKVCREAWRVIKEADDARERGDSEALDGHALLVRLKFAAGLAALCTGKLEVTDQWWEASGWFMQVSDATRAWAAAGALAERRNFYRDKGVDQGVSQAAAAGIRLELAVAKCGATVFRLLSQPDHRHGWTRRDLARLCDKTDGLLQHRCEEQQLNLATGRMHRVEVMKANLDLALDQLIGDGLVVVVRQNRQEREVFALADDPRNKAK
ncbi:MAG TPA: bifunctional DNA primase/polymerase [Sporichthyaceae bacterium]|jgi:hypothetical protein|nr:bifunctional DNA primase/polymerase [Sporichthyaceae bacterium]